MIEAIGGTDPAHRLTLGALAAGRSMIIANKELLAMPWDALAPHLLGERRKLCCFAAVGGAVPMMELVQRLVSGGQMIEALGGVVNGTTKFILDQQASGQSLEDAVLEAQEKGFTESDPGVEVDGINAARKIEILARIAWGHRPHTIPVTGIRDLPPAPQPGLSCRLVARAQRNAGARVSPEWLIEPDYLSHARGAESRLEVTTNDSQVHRVAGLGAGRYPTATAILADLLDVSMVIRQ